MRAIQIEEFGDPAQVLRVVDIEEPPPPVVVVTGQPL